MKCPNCNAELPQTSAFCFDCGAAINPPAQPRITRDSINQTPSIHEQAALSQLPASHTVMTPIAPETRRQKTWPWLVVGFLFLGAATVIFNRYRSGELSQTILIATLVEQAEADGLSRSTINFPKPVVPGVIIAPTGTSPAPVSNLPCPNGTLIFEDRFDIEPPLAQPLFDDPEMMIFQQWDGMGRIYSEIEQGYIPVMYPQSILDDFYVEVDVLPQSTELDYSFGLILRSDDIQGGLDFYHVVAVYPEKSELEFRTNQDVRWGSIDTAPIPAGLVGVGKFFTLRVEAVEDRVRVFIGGEYIETFQSNLESGIPGFFVLPSANREMAIESAEILFDNFTAYNTSQCNATAP